MIGNQPATLWVRACFVFHSIAIFTLRCVTFIAHCSATGGWSVTASRSSSQLGMVHGPHQVQYPERIHSLFLWLHVSRPHQWANSFWQIKWTKKKPTFLYTFTNVSCRDSIQPEVLIIRSDLLVGSMRQVPKEPVRNLASELIWTVWALVFLSHSVWWHGTYQHAIA
jgi:hypothetical protein